MHYSVFELLVSVQNRTTHLLYHVVWWIELRHLNVSVQTLVHVSSALQELRCNLPLTFVTTIGVVGQFPCDARR